MQLPEHFKTGPDLCEFRPRGPSTLVDAVALISQAIACTRHLRIARLLVDATGLVGIPVPSLVDRFLMVEEWAAESGGVVAVALVVHAEYIHPDRFGIKVAKDLGLVANVHASEPEARRWLTTDVDGLVATLGAA